MILKFTKTKDVKSPCKAYKLDAGIDFFIPNMFSITIPSHYTIKINSGIKVDLPEGWALMACNKSGIASKGLDVMACLIDSGYQGDIHISLCNTTEVPCTLYGGEKIIQFLLINVPIVTLKEVSIEKLYKNKSNRGADGFGSTGKEIL